MSVLGIPPAVLAHARRVAGDWRALSGVAVDADETLTGRAALLGIRPQGRVSAGGATHLLAARDGRCAITLSRPDDIAAVPALLESDDVADDPWPALHQWAATRRAAAVTARARLLGLPAATLSETPDAPPQIRRLGDTAHKPWSDLLVADLSSMWAGPLCGQLLARTGATVVKVESASRPDGTRRGATAFFDWMNSGKLSYAVEFDDTQRLRALLTRADVVIEGSRPAALARRGLGPCHLAGRPGRVWLRITGHGAKGDRANWVAFGDDAAVSGGLVGAGDDGPMFCGDAIADPLTGLHAALAAAESLSRGGGELIELSMAAVAAGYAALPAVDDTEDRPPRRPPPTKPASCLGADNAAVQAMLERRCATC